MTGNCGECSRRWFCEEDPETCGAFPDPEPGMAFANISNSLRQWDHYVTFLKREIENKNEEIKCLKFQLEDLKCQIKKTNTCGCMNPCEPFKKMREQKELFESALESSNQTNKALANKLKYREIKHHD